MIIELPNYVDLETIEQIRAEIKPHINPNDSTKYYRDGNTVYIGKIPELKELDHKLQGIFTSLQQNVLQQRYRPIGNSGDTGYEYHIYNPGDVCHYHSDGEVHNGSNVTLLRYASVVLHLNTVHEGGEIVFPEQGKSVKTEAGKVVIFPPYGMFGHYTTPSKEPREVIVTWYVYSNLNVVRI
jgi:hypothetical protein